ncbi:hypothetical protein ACS0TY_023335 [Phlomoides rotata]
MFLCSFDHHVYISFLKVWVLKQMQPSLRHILSIGLHQSQIQDSSHTVTEQAGKNSIGKILHSSRGIREA